jgi:hypothetical protein
MASFPVYLASPCGITIGMLSDQMVNAKAQGNMIL